MSRDHSHYFKDVSHLNEIDVYRVIDLFEVHHPALQHALKKVIACGSRGAKDARQDAQEAIDSLKRYLNMRDEDEAPAASMLDLPVIDTQINADKAEDRHAELRKSYRPGQRWQNSWTGKDAWNDLLNEPGWDQAMDYRRHPDDLPKPAEKPWYPDDSGEWVEVPDDLMEMPKELHESTLVQTLSYAERGGKQFQTDLRAAKHFHWGDKPKNFGRIVAYKVVKP